MVTVPAWGRTIWARVACGLSFWFVLFCKTFLLEFKKREIFFAVKDSSWCWILNRPFARSDHMVQDDACCDASYTVELPKQTNSHQSTLTCLCFGSPTVQLVLQQVILNSNPFPLDLFFSQVLSAISNSHYFKIIFDFLESLKWQVSTVCIKNLKCLWFVRPYPPPGGKELRESLWFKFPFYLTSILVSNVGLA